MTEEKILKGRKPTENDTITNGRNHPKTKTQKNGDIKVQKN